MLSLRCKQRERVTGSPPGSLFTDNRRAIFITFNDKETKNKTIMKETKFTRCYVNGRKAAAVQYDNGQSVLLYFSQSLGAGEGVEALRAAGLSLHQFNNSLTIPTATAEGIQSVIPGAVVDWQGTRAYEERVTAAVGSRGADKPAPTDTAAPDKPAAVVSSDAFRAPAVKDCPALLELVGNMPPVVDSVNSWGVEYAAAALNGGDEVAAPGCIAMLAQFSPAVPDAFAAYRATVDNAIAEYRERIEKERAARLAAEQAAAAAAANGKRLVTLPDGAGVEISGRAHGEFGRVCQLVKLGLNVYLHGPAGTGKTYLCKQVAEALGLDFYSDQKISNDYQLVGFVDAAGNYQETELYRAATRGGVYMADEFDASDECAAVTLNLALANRYMTFPGVGRVELHKDFRVIACGNTIGRGADSDYTGRNCLDAATLDRFVPVRVGYDAELELAKAGGDSELVAFIHDVRAAVKVCGVSLTVSMRAIENIAAIKDYFPAADCLKMGLLKGLEIDQVRLIDNACKGTGKWRDALKELAA